MQGIRVVDFSTLLPGPLATLILAEAGAEVIKIERPGGGDELRSYEPGFGGTGAGFTQLNRGKRSLVLDLKDPLAVERVKRLLAHSDVLVEQFRPGVMDRMGLGFRPVSEINPAIVYCSITGYGQEGPRAQEAGHDLNYLARSGVLSLAAGADGSPAIPPGLIADIGGGSFPAVMNILMALRRAESTGEGTHLDISMSDNLFCWTWWALGQLWGGGQPPRPGGELLTGGSPRYRIYAAADSSYLSVAALEQRFWNRFCEVIDLPKPLRDDRRDPTATIDAVAARIAERSARDWERRFAGEDVCCAAVATLEEALKDHHFTGRGLFSGRLSSGDAVMPAMPVPLAPALSTADREPHVSPELGESDLEGLLTEIERSK